MSKGRRILILLIAFCLLLSPLTAFACCKSPGTGLQQTVKITPYKVRPGWAQTSSGWAKIPGSGRIRVCYRLKLHPSPGIPHPPVSPPPAEDLPVTPPPAEDPPVVPPPDKELPPPVDLGLTVQEQQMWELVNAERAGRGLPELGIHPGLVKLARLKSSDMISSNYFAHQSPTYGSPFDMMLQEGISFRYAGENLAGAPTVERAHQSLMNSPGHRANILNPDFTHIGIGIVDGGAYGKMFTQMFIGIN